MNPTPHDFGISHSTWRPGQYELIQWLADLPPKSFAAFNLATGLGKTAVATALGRYGRTIACVALKSLQDQYVDYNFTKLMGRSNYDCVNPLRIFPSASAEDCLHNPMRECDEYPVCPYAMARAEAMDANRVSFNYHYAVRAGKIRWMQNDEMFYMWPKKYSILDEAHELHKVVIDHYSLEIDEKNRARYHLPDFEDISPTLPITIRSRLLFPWLTNADATMKANIRALKLGMKKMSKSKLKRMMGSLRRMERLRDKIKLIVNSVEEMPDDWYIKSGREGVVARPLTAKHAFHKLFRYDSARVIAMSATIGDFDDFFAELGVVDGQSYSVPSRFPPESRPVYVYKNCPKMSYAATQKNPSSWDKQADIIAGAILDCPSEWSGLIHVTRKKEAALLKARLDRRGLAGRTWAMPGYDGGYVPTGDQVIAWKERLRRVPNSILLSWCNWAGYDGVRERICVVAKAPYPIWGQSGSYEEAWRQYSMDRYRWMAATTVSQGIGRTRRGNDGDYDMNGRVNGMVAICDGSFDGRIENKMGPDILDSLVKV